MWAAVEAARPREPGPGARPKPSGLLSLWLPDGLWWPPGGPPATVQQCPPWWKDGRSQGAAGPICMFGEVSVPLELGTSTSVPPHNATSPSEPQASTHPSPGRTLPCPGHLQHLMPPTSQSTCCEPQGGSPSLLQPPQPHSTVPPSVAQALLSRSSHTATGPSGPRLPRSSDTATRPLVPDCPGHQTRGHLRGERHVWPAF